MNPPTADDPLRVQCPNCEGEREIDGKPCRECNGTGEFVVDQCPQQFIGREVVLMTGLVDLFHRGIPPVAGGALDQTRSFLDFDGILSADESKLREYADRTT